MDVSGTIGAILNQKSRDIHSISPDATVFEAVQLMDAKNVGALLVMDQERLVGIISERDYTRKIMLRGAHHQRIAAGIDVGPGEITVILADRVVDQAGAAGP